MSGSNPDIFFLTLLVAFLILSWVFEITANAVQQSYNNNKGGRMGISFGFSALMVVTSSIFSGTAGSVMYSMVTTGHS